MPFEDEWGHDPSIQRMRRVFSYMEEAQQELLKHLNISLFDKRLRNVREQALELFERAWPLAVRQGIIGNEKETAPLYIHCLARGLSSVGVRIPKDLLPRDEKITRFLKEKHL
jgi:tRNA A37 threonylcarbamoyladenosine synthetase subunit TsaC/SUA5/YrdC